MPTKIDVKKTERDLYDPPKGKFSTVDVPPMKFYMINGKGDPNTSQEFKDAIETLYAVSYGLKMPFKKKHPGKDYIVPPLEGLWYMDDMRKWTMENKADWQFTLMIRVPGVVPDADATTAIGSVRVKKSPPSIDKVRFESFHEGKSVQTMHVGPFDAEPPVIAKMHSWIKENGFTVNGHHHEIYLSDMRRVAPEKMRTVLRQPVK